jgi:periplasmic divalent cation tolerance protein
MNPASPEALEVLTTTEGQQQALDMARELIDQRLAACVQVVGPVTSVYRWQGRVETSE